MHFREETLDDALRSIVRAIIEDGVTVDATKGENCELIGVSVEITNPRARLSRTETRGRPFSCIGELLWYLSGSDKLEFIEYYLAAYKKFAEDDGSVYGAYGPRVFPSCESGQFERVFELLREKQSTRQAVIQIFSAKDIEKRKKDTPCTCTLQFLVRDERLHLIACMRSNDAMVGFPHDVFAFTMLQEIMASRLGFDVGTYRHFAGSMHIYQNRISEAEQFLNEGFQSILNPMPRMPREENPMEAVNLLLAFERKVRGRLEAPFECGEFLSLPEYWQDIATLLIALCCFKKKDMGGLSLACSRLHAKVYEVFVTRKIRALSSNVESHGGESLAPKPTDMGGEAEDA